MTNVFNVVFIRLNERILSTKTSQYIDLTRSTTSKLLDTDPQSFSLLKAPEMTAVVAQSCRYLAAKSEPGVRPLTVWLVADYDTDEGRALLLEAVKYLVSVVGCCCHIENLLCNVDTIKKNTRPISYIFNTKTFLVLSKC